MTLLQIRCRNGFGDGHRLQSPHIAYRAIHGVEFDCSRSDYGEEEGQMLWSREGQRAQKSAVMQ